MGACGGGCGGGGGGGRIGVVGGAGSVFYTLSVTDELSHCNGMLWRLYFLKAHPRTILKIFFDKFKLTFTPVIHIHSQIVEWRPNARLVPSLAAPGARP